MKLARNPLPLPSRSTGRSAKQLYDDAIGVLAFSCRLGSVLNGSVTFLVRILISTQSFTGCKLFEYRPWARLLFQVQLF